MSLRLSGKNLYRFFVEADTTRFDVADVITVTDICSIISASMITPLVQIVQ